MKVYTIEYENIFTWNVSYYILNYLATWKNQPIHMVSTTVHMHKHAMSLCSYYGVQRDTM